MTPNQMQAIMAGTRSQTVRYLLLMALNVARPAEASAHMLRTVVASVFADCTDLETLRELDYLQSRELITTRINPMSQTFAKIDRYGIDVLERTVDCDPGIILPPLA